MTVGSAGRRADRFCLSCNSLWHSLTIRLMDGVGSHDALMRERASRRVVGVRWPVRRAVALAVLGLLVSAAGALAAARFTPGALYTGRGCSSSGIPRTTCVFKFRATSDGRSLRFVGVTVVDTWRCNGGGGEALLGGEVKGATPIPRVRLRANGQLFGSVDYLLRRTQGAPARYKSTVTGHLTHAGRSAVVTFHNTYVSSSGNQPCATQPVTLTKH
jgi:hypothetical protein